MNERSPHEALTAGPADPAAGDTPLDRSAEISGNLTDFGFGAASAGGRDPLLGLDLGGIVIRRLLATGGMGRVYEGWQVAPDRPVAVKVMRPGLVAREFFKRFDHEARLLARLQHPGIAQIFLVGVHHLPAGEVPFFVMELIAGGVPITDFARRGRLGLRGRLDLFRQAAAAVAHGHERGVIHRDLKPGNILVDAAGRVKVIDFGVARSTDADAALTTLETDTNRILGTLQYMSPEQFAAGAEQAGVRSDVYALGVVLFELLADRLPYDVRRRPLAEAARIVRESPAPSLRSLDRSLPRDLDVIAATCLAKEPGCRYASVHELDADLGRHLTGEPILAAPPSLAESALRFARRHRAATLAATMVLAAILAAAGGILAFAIRAERAREVAETEREQAREALYVANLLGIATKRDDGDIAAARGLLAETEPLLPHGRPRPIELNALAASLDEALLVIDGPGGSVEAVAFSPDGQRVAAAAGGTARLWNATTGEPLVTFAGHRGWIGSLAFAPDGRLLATASSAGEVRMWNTAGGPPRQILTGAGKGFTAVCFTEDGTSLCFAGRNGRLFRAPLGRDGEPEALADLETPVRSLASAGDVVVAGTESGAAMVVSLADGTIRQQCLGHHNWVRGVATTDHDGRIATASSDCTFRLWDAASGRVVVAWGAPSLLDRAGREARKADLHHDRGVNGIAFSPDGTRLATASSDSTARLWDAGTGHQIRTLVGHAGFVQAVAWSRAGDVIATGSADGTVRVWDAGPTAGPSQLAESSHWYTAVAFSPDGRLLASGTEQGVIELWDPVTCEPVATLNGHTGGIAAIVFSGDGNLLVTASADGTARVWDRVTGAERLRFTEHAAPLTGLAFVGDRGPVVSGAADGRLLAWDATDGRVAWSVAGCPGGLHSIRVMADERRLLAVGEQSLHARDVRTGAPLPPPDASPKSVESFAISGTRDIVAVSLPGGEIRLWDTDGGTCRTLAGHGRSVGAIALSPDGTRLVSGDRKAVWDHSVRLWDTTTGKELALLRGHAIGVRAAAFSPAGDRVATASTDLRIWGAANAAIHAARLAASPSDARQPAARAARRSER